MKQKNDVTTIPILAQIFRARTNQFNFSLPWTIVHGRKGKFSQILK